MRCSPQLTVFGYDRWGRGDSGATLRYAVDREIEDIRALIEVAGGTAALYGHSAGAALALDAALQPGDSVSKIALYEPPCNDDPRRPAGVAPLPRAADRGAGSGPPRGRGGAVHGLRRDPGRADRRHARQQDFWPGHGGAGARPRVSPHRQFRLTLDALEIPAFRQIVTMPPLTLPVAGVAYNVNASLGTTGFLGADAGGVDEPDPPVQQVVQLLQPGGRVAGRPWLIACVTGWNVIVTVTGVPGRPVTLTRWPRLRRARRSSAVHAAEHGTRF